MELPLVFHADKATHVLRPNNHSTDFVRPHMSGIIILQPGLAIKALNSLASTIVGFSAHNS